MILEIVKYGNPVLREKGREIKPTHDKIATLAEAPAWVEERLARHGEERFRASPGPGRWSAHEVLCHLRDADAEVYLPRLERVLAEKLPAIEYADMGGWGEARGYRETPPLEALGAWRAFRVRLLARLAPLSAREWTRVAVHSVRGPFPLEDQVREWVEHDLSHRRQIAEALADFA